MYDGIATLVTYETDGFDQYGNKLVTEKTRDVFVQPQGIYASEFYNAAQLGLKPSLSLYIANRADYDGEKVLRYQGTEYSVIRVDWKAQRDGITLVCEERINNG